MSVRPPFPLRFSIPLLQVCAVVSIAACALSMAGAATKKTLYAFGSRHGAHPLGTLVLDTAGNLYGTTEVGGILTCGPDGTGGCGTVFQLAPQPGGTWKLHTLHNFAGGTDGALPYAGVILDAAGNLYGTTAAGGYVKNASFGYGTVFELSPGVGGWTETILHTFATQAPDGEAPVAPLVFDQSRNLYGTTEGGTGCGTGTIFQLAPNPQGGWTQNVLHCFPVAQLAYPEAGVIFDTAGNLYTTTSEDGPYNGGTVVQLVPSAGSWTDNVLYDFTRAAGLSPSASLIPDKNGNLYGITYGSFYQLTPSEGGWTYSILYEEPAGSAAIGLYSLIIDEEGNFYGTGIGPGSLNGAVVKITHEKNGWHQRVLYNFKGGADGSDPRGGLVLDQQGNLYGTTVFGGKNCERGCGTVFEITP